MKKRLFLVSLAILITSCSFNKPAVLWSNNRDTAQIIEIYNSQNDHKKIIFHFKEELVKAYLTAEIKPDIIIGNDLENYKIKSELMNIQNLYNKNDLDGNKIYNSLIPPGLLNGERHLLPLSFSMTTIIFNKGSSNINSNLASIELDLLRDSALSYNNQTKNRKGFSPLWDDDFIYSLFSLYNSNFTVGIDNKLSWNEEKLKLAYLFVKDWNNLNGESSVMKAFDDKYMYENRIKIINNERILCSAMNLSDFMELSENQTKNLDFIYLSKDFKIYPERVVYGGISKNSNIEGTAYDFLNWLIDENNQKKILKESFKNKSASFGILGGFSTLIDFNEQTLPSFYPILKNRIPHSDYLKVLTEKPLSFNKMKSELITNWLRNSINHEEVSLKDSYEKWENLQIPF